MSALTIKQKLIGISLLILLMSVFTSVTAWQTSRSVSQALDEDRVLGNQVQLLQDTRKITAILHLAAMDIIVDMSRLKGDTTPEHRQQLLNSTKQLEKLFADVQKLNLSEVERRIENEAAPEVQNLLKLAGEMQGVIKARDIPTAQGYDEPIDATPEKIRDMLDKYVNLVTAKKTARWKAYAR